MSHSSNENEHSSSSRSPYEGPVLSGTGVETMELDFELGDEVCGGEEIEAFDNDKNHANEKIEYCQGIIDKSYYESSNQVIINSKFCVKNNGLLYSKTCAEVSMCGRKRCSSCLNYFNNRSKNLEKWQISKSNLPHSLTESQIVDNVKAIIGDNDNADFLLSEDDICNLELQGLNYKNLKNIKRQYNVVISNSIVWTLCHGEQCKEYCFGSRRKPNWNCRSCSKKVIPSQEVVLSKFTRIDYLSKPEMYSKFNTIQKQVRSQKAKICYLETKVDNFRKVFENPASDAFSGTNENFSSIGEVFASASKLPNINQQLIELLETQVSLEMANKKDSNTEELSSAVKTKILETAVFLEEQIKCNAKKFVGHATSVRYSQSVLSLALSVMTRSKSAYEKLRQANIALPCCRQLSHYIKGRNVESGLCLGIYENLKSALKNGDRNMMLLNDETKIVAGIIYNCKDNSLVGYVDGSLDFNNIHKLFDEDSSKSSVAIAAKYCNQWMIRQIYGNFIHLCEYFLSDVPISGNVLRSQFHHVVLNCEMISQILIHAVMADGGGGNASMNNLVRASPAKSYTVHPYELSRKIALSNCVAHETKSVRNALLHSGVIISNKKDSTFTRSYLFNDKPIVWHAITTTLQLDQVNHVGGLCSTNLTNENVNNIDGFAAMNVEFAKIIFEEKTLTFMLANAEKVLNVTIPEIPYPIKSSFLKVNSKSRSLTNGDFLWKCRQLIKASENWPPTIFNPLPTLEFLCVINSLFNALLLNKDVQINAGNIAGIRAHCTTIFEEFFTPWEKESQARVDRKELNANIRYFAKVTIGQLKNSIFGFLDFCEYMIEMFPDKYLRALLSTSSVLENVFSIFKSMCHGQPLNPVQYNRCVAVYDCSTAGKDISKGNVGNELDIQPALESRGLETDTKRNAMNENKNSKILLKYSNRASIIIFNITTDEIAEEQILHYPSVESNDILHDAVFDQEINYLSYCINSPVEQLYSIALDEVVETDNNGDDDDDDCNDISTPEEIISPAIFTDKYMLGLNGNLSSNEPIISSIPKEFLKLHQNKSLTEVLLKHYMMLKYTISLWDNEEVGPWFREIYSTSSELVATTFELLLWDIVNDMFILESKYHATKQVAKSTTKLAFERRRRDSYYIEYEMSQCISDKFVAFVNIIQSHLEFTSNSTTSTSSIITTPSINHVLRGCRQIYALIFKVLKSELCKYLHFKQSNDKLILDRNTPLIRLEDLARDNLEFYSYFGWAVKNLNDRYKQDLDVKDFVSKFRLLKHEVTEEYLTKNVPRILCLRNLGGLTIPHEALKTWGCEILSLINTNFDTKLNGNSSARVLDEIIKSKREELFQHFQDSVWKVIFPESEESTMKIQELIFSFFLQKIVHARIGVYMDIIKQEETSRTAALGNSQTLRANLKAAKRYLNTEPVEMNSRITLKVVGVNYGDCSKHMEAVAVNDAVVFVKDEQNSDKNAVKVALGSNGNMLGYISRDYCAAVRTLLSLLEMNSTSYICTISNLGDSYSFHIVLKFTHMSLESFDKTIACLHGVSEAVAVQRVKKARKSRK